MLADKHKLLTCLLLNFIVFIESSDESKYRFPNDFLFGVSTSAYQIEGNYEPDGRGLNVWDKFIKDHPEKIHNRSTASVTCDSYHRWRDDVKLLTNLGVNFYRFSISWSRILPDGTSNNINMNGLRYYNDLINELIAKGIKPMVTLYHHELPLKLQELGGWNNPYMAYYFEDYSRLVFSYFGDRVKYWITLNAECAGYGDNQYPPGVNQSGIANYLCTHVMLLAHAKAYHLYDAEFRLSQQGHIGIATTALWYEPGSFAVADIEAAERIREFHLGTLLNPIYNIDGNYPKLVRERVDNVSHQEGYFQSRLPVLAPQEAEYIQGTYDFLGLNFYSSFLVKDAKEDTSKRPSKEKDRRIVLYKDDKWSKSNLDWLTVYPEGLRKLLKWVKEKFDHPDIIVTENGYSDNGELNDRKRIEYLQEHLKAVFEAIHEDGINVKGYSVWSLLDNFEWLEGYSARFGLHHVDFKDPRRRRTAKKSAEWYKKVIKERRIVDIDEIERG